MALFAVMALRDKATEGGSSPADLDPAIYADLIDPATKCVLLDMNESMANLPVFRDVSRQGAGTSFNVSAQPLRRQALYSALRKVRKYACPGLKLYSFRRAAAAATAISTILQEEARANMGHRIGTTTREERYTSKTATYDLQGLLTSGRQNLDAVQWLGDGSGSEEPLTAMEQKEVSRRAFDASVGCALTSSCPAAPSL